MTLLSGRKFHENSETDYKESVLISEDLIKQFDIKDPIGKRIVWKDTISYYIVGVVKNIYSRALWSPLKPVMIRYVRKNKYQHLLVKINPDSLDTTNKFMERKWKEIFPDTMYDGKLIDTEMQETNDINRNVSIMSVFLGAFAVLMTGIGLFTLLSLDIEKKSKEIGIRKVMGASVSEIAMVINLEFIINLGIATIFGGLSGYFIADFLMDVIWEYYLKLNIGTLFISIIVMTVVAILAVGYKTILTAKSNPIKSLRDE